VQFSLFGAAVAEPALDDLAGIILAGGDWVRAGDDHDAGAARLSIVVDEAWRVAALVEAFTELGLGASQVSAENGIGVRTDFGEGLVGQASRWTRGAVLYPPAGLVLTARGLRLWAIATGRTEPGGYLLGTADPDQLIHRAAGSQLAQLGLAATSISQRSAPGWRLTSTKRLRRVAELVGQPPPGSGADWPG
jgi:hypothetical protein